jgi:phytanoyl-CoA hydroxylase
VDTIDSAAQPNILGVEEIVAYRRDGYAVLRKLLTPAHVAACLDGLSDIAGGRIATKSTEIGIEPAIDPASVKLAEREDRIRKFARYIDDSPALHAAAMSRKLHLALDQLLGQGRVLFQDMALIKPPRIGSAKPWHQDAAYFRVSDPSLIVGVWIALDPATRENGCMELIRGSHLRGPAAHVPAVDLNVCEIRRDLLRLEDRVAVELEPGDALIFHALVHHYTAPNRSDRRRRAVQFHYHQLGLSWGSLEDHRRLFHDETGAYAGCTVQKGPVPPGKEFVYQGDTHVHPIVPSDGWR